jgi:hypothetical protein
MVLTTQGSIINATKEMSRAGFVAGMNAGGNALNSPNGSLFTSGSDTAAGAREAYINPDGETAAIANAETWERPLFNTMEYTFKPNFDLAYTLPLTGARTRVVEVELLFAELDRGIGPDERRFDVFINGELALHSFDIYTAAGGRERAVRASVFLSPAPTTVVVTFGKIVRKNKPTIGAVAVYSVEDFATTAESTTENPSTTASSTITVPSTTTVSTTNQATTTSSATAAPTTMLAPTTVAATTSARSSKSVQTN